jgi:hypothetical protein
VSEVTSPKRLRFDLNDSVKFNLKLQFKACRSIDQIYETVYTCLVKENEIPFLEKKSAKKDVVLDFFKQYPELLIEASRFVHISSTTFKKASGI